VKKAPALVAAFAALFVCLVAPPAFSQKRGSAAITEAEIRYHLEFLGAKEFRGRETPSPELEIAALYLGNWAKHSGLKPILADGSFYQSIPITVPRVLAPRTTLRVRTDDGERVFDYGRSFGGDFTESGSYSGEVVFAGLGISEPDRGWDDLKDLDLYRKVAVILDAQRPGDSFELGSTYSFRLFSRINAIRQRGAAAVLSIVPPDLQAKKDAGLATFEDIPIGRLAIQYETQRRGTPPPQAPAQTRTGRPPLPFVNAHIDHAAAAAVLGLDRSGIAGLFEAVKDGRPVAAGPVPGRSVRLDTEVEVRPDTTRNVVAQVEGSDPVLKKEYVVVCAHYDHLGISDGEIIAGADDNGTATAALMGIARALTAERPRRTVILAWFTGEERGYIGSHYFVNNCPVPVERISACLNMDMLGRNETDHLFLVGSDLLSSELDQAIHRVNRRYGLDFRFDYAYSNLTHPQRVYFRSDQYPHIRFGIPSVWFFCGFTPDYHTPRDVLAAVDYKKVWRCARLVYLTAMEVAGKPALLKLDVNPEVTSRGRHNLAVKSLYENIKQ